MLRVLLFLALFSIIGYAHSDEYHPDSIFTNLRTAGRKVEDPESWRQSAQDDLKSKLQEQLRVKKAKNVIMFLGDGWGVPTITAARILKGQERDGAEFGEEARLHIETFPHTGTSRTFCTDAQTADSACSATAYLCGMKANTGTIGVTSDVQRYNCTAQHNVANHVSSILAWAQAAGKSTGVVTTTRITHASPAGTYAHIANRDWECDANIPRPGAPVPCDDTTDDIAEQLIEKEPGRSINVLLGGGRKKFLPTSVKDIEDFPGERLDEKNLIEDWKKGKANTKFAYVETKEDLMKINAESTDYLLGLFSSDHMSYYHEQAAKNDPSLSNMTQKAIEILRKNPNGFFLFVEGGLIDWAHHDNEALKAVWEAVEFDSAIQKGDEMTDDEDTLIVITADHSHAFTFNGYAARGSPIWGLGGVGLDNLLPFSTMNYANGPGFVDFVNERRHNISEDDLASIDNRIVPLVNLSSETHGGEDVMIFAKGPFSHLLGGVHLQSYIPHAMAYAACLGNGETFCRTAATTKNPNSAPTTSVSSIALLLLCLLSILLARTTG